MKKTFLLILFGLLATGYSWGQTRVTGTVFGAEDGKPLAFVTVVVKGTTTTASTNSEGRYSIMVPSSANTLVFSFMSYTTVEENISGRSVIDVTLNPESRLLDETVVIGYATVSRKAFTGSAASASGATLTNITNPNPIKALDGVIPGMQMNVATGQPGAPATIFIRGRNSLNSGTQPLYIIDGIIMSNDNIGTRQTEGQITTPLASINSNDIENITVLKDATATSIYGSRAANGVIVITTKKGREGRPRANLDVRLGFEQMPSYPSRYKMLNQDRYVDIISEGLVNSQGWTKDRAETYLFESVFEIPRGTKVNTDWEKEVTRTGFVQEYNFSVQGGGSNAQSPTYFLSLGALDNTAFMRAKDLARYSVRFNLEHSPGIVSYGINSTFAYTDVNLGTSGGYYGDPLTQARMQAPLSPVYTETGAWNFNTVTGYNPVAQWSKLGDVANTKTYRTIISPFAKVQIMPELSFMTRAGADIINSNDFGYWSFLQPQGADMNGMGENGTDTRRTLTWTNTLNWNKTLNERHSLSLLLGQELQHSNIFQTYLAGSNYPVDNLNMVDLASIPSSAGTNEQSLALASFFLNAQYSFDNKYFLSGSVRTDGSSRFIGSNRWGTFYSFGGRYRIYEEEFMAGTRNWLSQLAIRASFGTSGNQQVGSGYYAARGLYGFGYNYNHGPGFAREQAENPDLKWEQTRKFNVGIDLGFFNRLNLELDYYRHLTTDMVFNVPISMTTGIYTVSKNVGKLENNGVEFTLHAGIIDNANFKWNATFVGSHNQNRIKKLSTDLPIDGNITITEVGRDIYTFKMREFAGVDPQTGAELWYKGTEGTETTTNYNEAGRRYVGSASPNFFGSFTNVFKLYGFDLSIQLNYSFGGKIYGDNLRYDEHIGGGGFGNTTNYVYDNRWIQPGDIASVPKFVYGKTNLGSTRFLMNGDFVQIRNIMLGYTLPAQFVKKLSLASIRLYATGDNLYTFAASNYRGYDPSGIGPNGIQWWNYPLPRNIMFGINVGF